MDIEQAVTEIAKNPAWGTTAARRCLSTNFTCEYCGMDFLESPVSYKQIQFDHIIPKHLAGPDSEENVATVCRTCNMDWKSRWDPRTVAPAGASREELIAACRQRVREKREEFLAEVERLRGILGAAQQGVGAVQKVPLSVCDRAARGLFES